MNTCVGVFWISGEQIEMEKGAEAKSGVAGESKVEEKTPPQHNTDSEDSIKISDEKISREPVPVTEEMADSASEEEAVRDQDEPEINVFLDRLQTELILGNEYILETGMEMEEYSKVQEDPYERPLVMRGEETRNEDNRGEDDPFPERSDFIYENEFLKILLSFIEDIEPPQNYLSAKDSGTTGYLRTP
jgi:hypothetical protein